MASSAHDVMAPALRGLIEDARATGTRVALTRDPTHVDTEAIHDFRVALRRLRTVLRVARRVYGKRRMRAIGEGLKQYAAATGTLRDEEVLRETLDGLELPSDVRSVVEHWSARRARQERSLRSAVARLMNPRSVAKPRTKSRSGAHPGIDASAGSASANQSPITPLERWLRRLEKRLSVCDGGPTERRKRAFAPAVAVASDAIERAMSGVRACAGEPADDVAAMHALRIAFKRLRYTSELFEPLLGDDAAALARSGARMQRRLGHLHDLDQALIRMTRAWGLEHTAREAVVTALREARARGGEKATRDLTVELLAIEERVARIRTAAKEPTNAFAPSTRNGAPP